MLANLFSGEVLGHEVGWVPSPAHLGEVDQPLQLLLLDSKGSHVQVPHAADALSLGNLERAEASMCRQTCKSTPKPSAGAIMPRPSHAAQTTAMSSLSAELRAIVACVLEKMSSRPFPT